MTSYHRFDHNYIQSICNHYNCFTESYITATRVHNNFESDWKEICIIYKNNTEAKHYRRFLTTLHINLCKYGAVIFKINVHPEFNHTACLFYDHQDRYWIVDSYPGQRTASYRPLIWRVFVQTLIDILKAKSRIKAKKDDKNLINFVTNWFDIWDLEEYYQSIPADLADRLVTLTMWSPY